MQGVFQSGTGNRFDEITDGLSNTLLMGEKHVPKDKLGMGAWDCSIYNGGSFKCSARAASEAYPLITDPKSPAWAFGSMHITVVQFVFADGHVEALHVSTDPRILSLLSMRSDGQVIPDY
jgi:prepilin-type processing-associated H-X9-DG protein